MTACNTCKKLIHQVIYLYDPTQHKEPKSNIPVYFCGPTCMIKWDQQTTKGKI